MWLDGTSLKVTSAQGLFVRRVVRPHRVRSRYRTRHLGQLYIARPQFRTRMPTHVETLENGLKVILRPISDTRAVSTWVVYRIGSRNEVPGMTGSTDSVGHIMFNVAGKLGQGHVEKPMSSL